MLRPATPLSLLLFAAFALLLLSVLSTPIIQGIPLGSFKGVTYGVFGFCTENPPQCSPIEVGYNAGMCRCLLRPLPSILHRSLGLTSCWKWR